jgi:hypothetical protein
MWRNNHGRLSAIGTWFPASRIQLFDFGFWIADFGLKKLKYHKLIKVPKPIGRKPYAEYRMTGNIQYPEYR